MYEIFIDIYNFLGVGNVLDIIFFLITLFFAFYFYYKTFYRLVFTCKTVRDWRNGKTDYETRILFYNNGRKTLTKNIVNDLTIKSREDIIECKQIATSKNVKFRLTKKSIKINFDYLNTSDFFLLEVKHKKALNIEGRISETGKILHTETQSWLIFNLVFILICVIYFSIIGLNFYSVDENMNTTFILNFIINIFLIYFIMKIIRYIHSLFFIPDKIVKKYLRATDKFHCDFKNKF